MLKRRSGRGGPVRRLLPLLLLLLLLGTAGSLFFRPWHGSGTGHGHPRSPRPSAAATRSAATAQCPPIDLAGVGTATAFWREQVEPVHRAACAGDIAELARLLGGGRSPHGGHGADFATEECDGCTASQIIAMWQGEYDFKPSSLARLLEKRPIVDQGGLIYVRGDQLATFARGTHSERAAWSGFYVRCHEQPDCRLLSTTL